MVQIDVSYSAIFYTSESFQRFNSDSIQFQIALVVSLIPLVTQTSPYLMYLYALDQH